MDKISEKVRIEVYKRDKYRCRECGIQVIKRPGLRPHIHHIIPKSAGGEDTKDNLITLCEICHITKVGHHRMFLNRQKDIYPQFIKWALWDIGLNMIYFSMRTDPRRFPTQETIKFTNQTKELLEKLFPLVQECKSFGKLCPSPSLDEIIESLKKAHISHDTQRTLDGILLNWWNFKQG